MAGISASDVNASIPLSAKPPEVNPLDVVGKFTSVQQGMLNNRLLQGQLPIQAEQQKQAVQATGTGAEAERQAQMATYQKKAAQAQTVLKSLITAKTYDRDAIANAVKTNLYDTGFLDPKNPHDVQVTGALLGQLMPGNTPEALAHNASVLPQMALALGSGTTEDQNSVLGSPQTINTGPAQVITRVGGATNQITPMGTVANALSPQDLIHLNNVTDQTTGKVSQVPVGEQFDAYGHLKPDAGTPTAGGGAASPAGGQQNGRYPAPSGPRSIGAANLPPGQGEMMAASAKAFTDDTAAVPQIRKTLTTFDQAMDAIKKAPIGVGSDKFQAFRGLAETYGIKLPQNVKDEAEAYQEFSKWSNSALAQESSRLGLGTDAARQIQAEAQPGTHTIKDAAVKMLPILKGLKAMDLAAPVIAQAQGVTPQQYNTWRAGWANSVDPLAFGAGSMSVDQRRSLIDKMSADEKKRYAAGLQAAIQAGVFSKADLAK